MPSATDQSLAYTRAQLGLSAPVITVETHLPGGLPGFTIVGMPEIAVREARDRVKSAITNSGLDFPLGRVLVNLAPADLAKEGARLDLAIAVSVLSATSQVPWANVQKFEFVGELSLSGQLRPVRGALCAALAMASENGQGRRLIAPEANLPEFAIAPPDAMVPAASLLEVVRILQQPDTKPTPQPTPVTSTASNQSLDQVAGQNAAKHALVVAAAGGHHLLLIGPPGTGKTLLARGLTELLPALTIDAAREVAAVYSAAGMASAPFVPPFRDPHHSTTAPAMVGGGKPPQPGEISLAHRGVLFLDELPHFKPSVLNLLREPLETRSIELSRSGYRAFFPADLQLAAAMNPCPAGLVCKPGQCRCTPAQVQHYQARISGPLLDRIDLHIPVQPVASELLLEPAQDRDGAELREQVAAARATQVRRQGTLNAALGPEALIQATQLDAAGRKLVKRSCERFNLSARGIHKVLKVARTIADLNGTPSVAAEHVAQALTYRAIEWAAH